MPRLDLETITQQFEAFFEELEREYYLEGAGLKDEIRAAEIYERYQHLSSLERVSELRQALAQSPDDRKLRLLVETAVQSYLGNRTRTLTDELVHAESSGTIRLEGPEHEMSFRSSAVALINEPDRSRRQAIAAKRDAFVEAMLNPAYERIADDTWAGLRELGYETYAAMVEELSGMDFTDLATTTGEFLRQTEEMYGDVLSWFAKRTLGVRLADLEKHDLGVVARATQFDPLFPGDRMVSAVLGFVGTMGVDATAGGKIRLDLEVRPKKSPRAFCSAVRVPDEVYLVIRPSGGIEDYKAFLHELGHALHFGHTDPAAAWEARRLGDNSVTETYAMLFDHLLHDRLWLRKVAGISDARALLRHSAFIELMMLRRYSAKFAYELELHARPSREGCRELYRDMLTHATKARYSVAHYLADVDAFFYSARYLRAWMLQQAAALALRDRFDEDWFLNPRAGTYLTQLWASGQGVSAEELAREFGQQTLTMEPLRRQLEQVLGA